MDNVILNSYSKIPSLNVSRETCNELESLITIVFRGFQTRLSQNSSKLSQKQWVKHSELTV